MNTTRARMVKKTWTADALRKKTVTKKMESMNMVKRNRQKENMNMVKQNREKVAIKIRMATKRSLMRRKGDWTTMGRTKMETKFQRTTKNVMKNMKINTR